uniref:Putative cysteine s-methyltransferase n=1 Tax=Xenopsylla cheopis TaxID=163159 RepID=A0A6M2DH83_XENCH
MENKQATTMKTRDLRNVIVLDGGFSTQLAKYVGPDIIDKDPLWSARYNATRPQDVMQVHLDYLKAGADIISTNTYQASIEGYMQYLGLTRQESLDLINSTVNLAFEARDIFQKDNNDKKPLVMGSVGPYGAHLHDGSEYNGSYAKTISEEELKAWHRPRINALIEAGVDGLAIETIPCQLEAEALINLIVEEFPGTTAWMSFQCKDDSSLASGDNFREAALSCWKLAAPTNCLLAIGANCIHPKYVAGLFASLKQSQTFQIPLIVYPNSSEQYIPDEGRWQKRDQCTPLEKYVSMWTDLGVKFIGGCCRTDDEYIRNTRKILNDLISK